MIVSDASVALRNSAGRRIADAEIEIKKRRGYPQDNIIFEDSREAVLIQNRQEVIRCPVDDTTGLEKLLSKRAGGSNRRRP